MKKTIAITSALAAASSLATAEIKINEFLSFAGFVDMSYTSTDGEVNGVSESDNSFGIDQVEVDWMFNFGKVTAQVDLEYEDNAAQGNNTNVEQAFVSYDLGDGAAITAGRYESMLGLEAKEPTGPYQYSTAYGAVGTAFLPQYAQGVKFTKTSGDTTYALSVQDESFNNDGSRFGGDDGGSYGFEAGATHVNGSFTYFIGGAYEENDGLNDIWIANAHVTYVDGPWTIGAEIVVAEFEALVGNDTEVLAGLVMANYAYSDCCSVTGRVSYGEVETGAAEADAIQYTLAHNYAVTDNLAVITEISYADADDNSGNEADSLLGAVEVLFTF